MVQLSVTLLKSAFSSGHEPKRFEEQRTTSTSTINLARGFILINVLIIYFRIRKNDRKEEIYF